MADLMGVGISGLLTSRRVLSTIGHNIANVNTEGYSRQRVDLAARVPALQGSHFAGNGVQAINTRRVYDAFVTAQLRNSASGLGHTQTYNELIRGMDNLLADPAGGLSPALQSFFDSVHEVASDPGSTSARQVLLSEASTLAQRFRTLDSRLGEVDAGVNERLSTLVTEINELSRSIADLNKDIVRTRGASDAQQPNDLLDQRDRLVQQLAERVNVSTVEQDDGSLNVATGSGQMLVAGASVAALSVIPDSADPSRDVVAYSAGGVATPIGSLISGGSLGGVLDFRRQVLDEAHNALGRVAAGLAQSFNAQHTLGMTLDDVQGGNFFAPVDASSPQALRDTANTGAPPAQIDVSITDVGALSTSDYRLDRLGASYRLTRLSDNTVTNLSSFPGAAQTVDGFTLDLAGGTIADGDSFLVRPVRAAAQDFAVALTRTADIAAAARVRSQTSLANLGEASIVDLQVGSTANLPLAGSGGDIALSFDPDALGPGSPGFTVTGGPGGALAYDPATEAAGKSFGFPGYGAMSFTVSGIPRAGDTLRITDNTGAGGDGTNALSLAGLQSTGVLDSGRATYGDAYGRLVVQTGARTRQSDINLQAQKTLRDQSLAAREAASGVNLDEEAADLMRFQQAYQASAQVVAAADTLFSSLLDVVRR